MQIDGFSKNRTEKKEDKMADFFLQEQMKMERELQSEEADRKNEYEMEKRTMLKFAENAFHHWQTHEFEAREQNKKRLLYASLILAAIIGYAVYINSPMMAITFILIGVVGYIYADKEPRILDFMITEDGIIAGKEIFEYERIKSFWIFYEEDGSRVISLHMRSIIAPYMHIPIGNEDPVKIREALLENVEEIKQEHNIVETLERLFRI